MANTLIQLKYSQTTNIPPSLNIAEPAYSYTSNTLFIGTPDGTGSMNVGGVFYTTQIDSATNNSTPNSLVRRDESGNASFNHISANTINADIFGVSEFAKRLETPRVIEINGDAEGQTVFDGSANVTITIDLVNTGVVANTYGGATQIPVITVDEDGRITNASNVAIATNLLIAADTGSNTVSLLTDTITFVGGDGIVTSIDPTNNVKFDVDNTVIRTNGVPSQTINTDLNIVGNVSVSGNTYYNNVQTLNIADPLIYLASNNYFSDVVDIGFAGNYYDGATQRHTGVVRIHGTNEMYLFTNYDEEFNNNTLNIANPSLVLANLHANLVSGYVENLAAAIKVTDGGTGKTSFTTGSIVVGNGTGELLELSNTSSAGTYGNSAFVPVVTVDNYGRVSSVSVEEIKVTIDDITGILPVVNGGLGSNTFTVGSLVTYDGDKFVNVSNTIYSQTGSLSKSNTVSSITVDSYGRITALTSESIEIDTSQIITGVLGVSRGGTGANSFTTNGVLLGNGTGAFNTASSVTEGHILTINASGVPTFSMLSGGTF